MDTTKRIKALLPHYLNDLLKSDNDIDTIYDAVRVIIEVKNNELIGKTFMDIMDCYTGVIEMIKKHDSVERIECNIYLKSKALY